MELVECRRDRVADRRPALRVETVRWRERRREDCGLLMIKGSKRELLGWKREHKRGQVEE
jgi:hypothetical protein